MNQPCAFMRREAKMGENNRSLSRFYAYVVDDGWNLPHEETKEADLKVVNPKSKPYEEVCRQNRNHKGSWLTSFKTTHISIFPSLIHTFQK